jgi:hypothetical protein
MPTRNTSTTVFRLPTTFPSPRLDDGERDGAGDRHSHYEPYLAFRLSIHRGAPLQPATPSASISMQLADDGESHGEDGQQGQRHRRGDRHDQEIVACLAVHRPLPTVPAAQPPPAAPATEPALVEKRPQPRGVGRDRSLSFMLEARKRATRQIVPRGPQRAAQVCILFRKPVGSIRVEYAGAPRAGRRVDG